MKQIIFVIMATLLLCCEACSPQRSFQTTDPASETVLIKVEYRDEPGTGQTVIQVLKSARVADWTIKKNGDTQDIESRYRSLINGQAEDIKERLEQIHGVLYVEIKRDGMPVKNPFL